MEYLNSKNKIKHFDTAPSYGLAEKNIGDIFNDKIIVDTKLSKLNNKLKNKEKERQLKLSFLNSLKKLQNKKVETLYVHSFDNFLRNRKIYISFLKDLKKNKIINFIKDNIFFLYVLVNGSRLSQYDKLYELTIL